MAAVLTAGLSPVAGRDVRVLVLGSLPGVRSLQQQQYYAHARNAFWTIAGTIAEFDPALPYSERCARLTVAGIGLWDVLAAAIRPGSLDSAIDTSTAKCNDFATFFRQHDRLRLVACNGRKAGTLFERHVLPRLGDKPPVRCVTLPSTSPANAAMSHDEKYRRWSVISDFLRDGRDETS
jgi:hypoxanthine-DNA glycosylase